jgi:hypothetical protein
MSAIRIFNRLSQLLDVAAARAAAAWPRFNTDGTVTERTAAQMLGDIGAAASAHTHAGLYLPQLVIYTETDTAAGTSTWGQIGNAVALPAGSIWQWVSTCHLNTAGTGRLQARLAFTGTVSAPLTASGAYRGGAWSNANGNVYSFTGWTGSPPATGLIHDATNYDRFEWATGFIKVGDAGNLTLQAYRYSGTDAPYIGAGSCIVLTRGN